MESNTAIAKAAKACGVKYYQITSRDRTKSVAKARGMAMQLLRDSGWSLPRIGAAFCRHHTTVLCYTDESVRAGKRKRHLSKMLVTRRRSL